jgi:hypothetical protein
MLFTMKVMRSALRAVERDVREVESHTEIEVGSVPVETALGETAAEGRLPPSRLQRGVGEVGCPRRRGRTLAPLATHA